MKDMSIAERFLHRKQPKPNLAGAGAPVAPHALEARNASTLVRPEPSVPPSQPLESTPGGPKKIGRRTLLVGLAAVGTAAAINKRDSIADVLGLKKSQTEAPPATSVAPGTTAGTLPATSGVETTVSQTTPPTSQVEQTFPPVVTPEPTTATTVAPTEPPTSPETTVEPQTTTEPTTEAPTTLPERVFASVEQKAQVEAVERNMADFFAITPEDLSEYALHTRFDPAISGFNVLEQYSPDGYHNVLPLNLGTFSLPVGDNSVTLHVFGIMSSDGSRFVTASVSQITDPRVTSIQPDYDQEQITKLMRPIKEGDPSIYFASRNSFEDDTAQILDGAEARNNYLNNNIGVPFMTEYVYQLQDFIDAGFSVAENQEYKDLINGLYEAADRGKLDEELALHTEEELRQSGVFKAADEIPQEFLQYATLEELVEDWHLSLVTTLFSNIPSVMTP